VLQDKIINRCRNRFRTPVTPIIHDIDYINEGLEIGQYFFTDIVKEGILLYDTGTIKFTEPRELPKSEMKEIAQRYFNQWFKTATNFLSYSKHAFEKLIEENEPLNDAVFLLHQSTERFYNTMLLVFTSYKPKTHNLDKLRHYAKPLSAELFSLFPFPVEDKQENHLFDLLKRGYVEARYNENYQITKQELAVLMERVQKMKDIVEKICKEKIASFNK
jgi:HEPN domain-containing protein